MQGPVQKKMWGPSPGAADRIFPGKKLATFFGHHCHFYPPGRFPENIFFGLCPVHSPYNLPPNIAPDNSSVYICLSRCVSVLAEHYSRWTACSLNEPALEHSWLALL